MVSPMPPAILPTPPRRPAAGPNGLIKLPAIFPTVLRTFPNGPPIAPPTRLLTVPIGFDIALVTPPTALPIPSTIPPRKYPLTTPP